MEFLADHQLNFMLVLAGACASIIMLLIFTKAMTLRRKLILILMDLNALLLISFDRLAYLYPGHMDRTSYFMVRFSNFVVFFMTGGMVFAFSLYVAEIMLSECRMSKPPKRVRLVAWMAMSEMILVIIAHFTGFFYYFDVTNKYHRGPGFLIAYIIPVLGPMILLTVVWQFRRQLSRWIRISLLLFIIAPVAAAIIQIFAYGLSLVNITMTFVAVFSYVFAYLDLNDSVERAKQMEIDYLKENQSTMNRLFTQTARAFVNAVDERGLHSAGHSERVADYALKLAKLGGMNEEKCEEVYYCALLHDVGKIQTPDSILDKDEDLSEEEQEEVRKQPVIGSQILQSISDFQGIDMGARYHCERYDGQGYPDGISGEAIPEPGRIVAVANAYDIMTTSNSYRDPLPQDTVREVFVREGGAAYDPKYARLMVQMIDEDPGYQMKTENEYVDALLHNEFTCDEYRSTVSYGIRISSDVTLIRFRSEPTVSPEEGFSNPAVILFDSQDRRVHDTARAVEETRYVEYAELWFDGHTNDNFTRNMTTTVSETETPDDDLYEIETYKCGDHIRVRLRHAGKLVEVIAALQDNSRYAYVGLTGENCHIMDIDIANKGPAAEDDGIERIAPEVSYIDRLESDVPNVQVDGYRSASTDGIPVTDGLTIEFHTMSLPAANLVWHCPYIILYSAKDAAVYGEDYREYALIRLDGEVRDDGIFSENDRFVTRQTSFAGWDNWKEINQKGYEVKVTFKKTGHRVTTISENHGIRIENTTLIKDPEMGSDVRVVITGDLVALTDIRIH